MASATVVVPVLLHAATAWAAAPDFLEIVRHRGMGFAFGLAFVGGVLVSLTPCVYPMIPVTVAVFGARGAPWKRGFALSLVYVLGIATTYTALGVWAALTGHLFGSLLASPWVLGFFAALFTLLGLHMLGLFPWIDLWLSRPVSWASRLGGAVANIHLAQSLNVQALRARFDLYRAVVFQRSSLSRDARERIAVIVSAANRSLYCVTHHAEALREIGEPAGDVAKLVAGEMPATLGPADRALLRWAQQAAVDPAACKEEDVARLRAHGLDDRTILDAALTAAYFSFVNRPVLMLGVEVESDPAASCRDVHEESR